MKMKKLAGLLVAGLIIAGGKLSHAANNASVQLAVTINSSIDISIVGTSTITFPAVALNTAGVVGSNAVAIRNDSVGLSVTYSLAGNNDSDWAWAPAAGANAFAVRALFNTAAPVTGDFSDVDDLVTVGAGPFPGGYRTASATNFAGTQSGLSVAPAASRNLWAKFIPATSSGVLFGSRSLYLNVVAGL